MSLETTELVESTSWLEDDQNGGKGFLARTRDPENKELTLWFVDVQDTNSWVSMSNDKKSTQSKQPDMILGCHQRQHTVTDAPLQC